MRIKNISPFYVGTKLSQTVGDYVFYSHRGRFPQIVTDAGETKRWWENPNVRQIMERPVSELPPTLRLYLVVIYQQFLISHHLQALTEKYLLLF